MPTPSPARHPGRAGRIQAFILLLALAIPGPRAVAASPPPAPTGAPFFQFPTANHALLEPGGEARFFAPTPGRDWRAGQFGCVRSEGWQFHEGVDILRLKTDRRGEPIDEVLAAAPGEVAYISRNPALSNYGIYVVLRHVIERLEVFTLYAHLSEVRADLAPGRRVQAGERLGVMGRTANTSTSIGKDRAHLHFEIALFLNDRFPEWLQSSVPGSKNDHGAFNGRNLLGLDPAAIFIEQRNQGPTFSLLAHIREQRPLFRALIAKTSFPWLRRYPFLIRRNRVAESEGIAAYEASFNFNGVPFLFIPRAPSEIEGPVTTRLLSVDPEEYKRAPCRKLVVQRGRTWTLTARGQELLDLLVY